ncbi:protein of unknown function [Taphrina deformans PYCC 5710]|uniref:FHF complex subunit HOOK-interacting protein C-terminal domain-containing protein n=1 Tax=Taphrina deformans (strain PYCC 5710 / ATCC 11124 / CBS 356.35 / IMI 108563 / JCM 9778 / NBRC 8474) TaxID=1097556 RepID=R4X9F1_TAPDE|nr:protein of unknown function [Taphrina deformans PYCC 5710]|eukprot:CCG82330.1 protein of unknown function [Taphrina deformans PYCC 5710]
MQWLENSTLAEALTRGLASHYLYLGRILASNHESRHCSSAGSPRLSKTDHGQQKLELEVSQTYLAYWQDVYEILENKNIRQGLLDSFRRFFLDDILRPAICASVKDTSKHVVYVWLGAIFDILRIPAVVELTIGHCFGTGAPYESTHLAASPTSTILLDEMHNVPLQSGRFSLEKYVLCYLDSDAEDCRLAAITLLDSLVVHHWQIVAPVFCSGKKVTKVEAVRAFGRIDQRRRVNSLACAGLIATEITQSTKNHTYDADSRLVAQCEDLERLLCPLTDTSDQITVSAAQCTFQGSDALLASLLLVLQNFFENSIELNLALSKLWTDLVSSPHQSLDGLLWATVAKDFYNESFLEANFENSTERLLDELEGAYQEELESLQEIESSFFDETDIGASDTQGNDMYSTDEVSRDLPPLVASLVTLSARVRGYKTDNTFTTAEIEAYKGDLEAMCNLTTTGAREETRHRWQGLPTPAFERTILWCNMFIFEEFIEELKGTVQVRQSLWDPCEYI